MTKQWYDREHKPVLNAFIHSPKVTLIESEQQNWPVLARVCRNLGILVNQRYGQQGPPTKPQLTEKGPYSDLPTTTAKKTAKTKPQSGLTAGIWGSKTLQVAWAYKNRNIIDFCNSSCCIFPY